MTWQRESVIDFTIPVWEGSNAMVMRTGKGLERYLVHIKPLSTPVWIAILATMPAACLSLWYVITKHPLYSTSPYRKYMQTLGGEGYWKSVLPCPRLESVYFQILGSFCSQALHWRPKFASDKVVIGAVWIFSVILMATYTGNLIASLTVHKRTWPVDTLQDLADQTTYTAGLVRGQAMMQVLQEATSGVYRKIWKLVVSEDSNIVSNLNQGFNKMLGEDYIFMDDYKNLVAMVAEEGDCSLHIAKEKFLHTGYGFPLQAGSAYLEEFNRRIQMMIEGGLLQTWIKRYWPKNQCGTTGIGAAHAISIEETAGAFIILLTGIASAIVMLLIEKHRGRLETLFLRLLEALRFNAEDVKRTEIITVSVPVTEQKITEE